MPMQHMRASLVLSLLLGLAVPAAAEPVAPLGPSFRLNQDPACFATAPQVAFFPGHELWVWEEEREIVGAEVPPGGSTVDERQTISGSDPAFVPRVDQAADGSAWAAWVGRDGTATVRIRRLDSPSSTAELSGEGALTLDVAAAPGGHALVAWVERRSMDDPPERLVFQQISAAGEPLDVPRVLWTSEHFLAPAVAALSPTRFLVTWLDSDDPGPTIRAMILTNTGTVEAPVFPTVPAFVVNEGAEIFPGVTAQSAPEAAALPGGGFAIAWTGTIEVDPPFLTPFLRVFDETGSPRGPFEPVETDSLLPYFAARPGLAADEAGRIALAWPGFRGESVPTGPSDQIVGAVLLDALGQPMSEAFEVRRIAGTEGLIARNVSPRFDLSGNLLVTWDEGSETPPILPPDCVGGGHFISGRRFATGCTPGALCLQDNRFEVTVTWEDPFNGGTGVGHPRQLTGDTGSFWFFSENNLELMAKVLDGRGINGHWWVFFGSLTNVGFELTVVDRATGEEKTYTNPPFTFASRGDTTAFDGSEGN